MRKSQNTKIKAKTDKTDLWEQNGTAAKQSTEKNCGYNRKMQYLHKRTAMENSRIANQEQRNQKIKPQIFKIQKR